MVERNMCDAVKRGIVIPPGSRATSRAKGSRRNLGGLVSGRQMLRERDGPHREGEEPKPMMHGYEKSDPAIVAVKSANKTERSTAEEGKRTLGCFWRGGRVRLNGSHCEPAVGVDYGLPVGAGSHEPLRSKALADVLQP